MSFNPNNLQLPQFPLSSLVNIPPLSLQNFQTSSVPLPTSVPSLLGKREFQTSPYSYHRRLEKKVKGNFQEDLLRTYMASQAVDQPWDHLSGNLMDHRKVNMRQNTGFEGVFSQASNGYPAPYPRQSMALSSFQNQLQATQNMNQVNKWMLEQHRLLQKGADQEDGLIIPKLEADEMNPTLKSSAGNVHIKVDIAKIRSFKEKHKTWNKSKKQTPKSSLPVLTEFTKAFPDWDLRTIFDFLHSGKSREEFETKMKSRKPRKKRRVKRRGPVRYFNNTDGEQAGPEANR